MYISKPFTAFIKIVCWERNLLLLHSNINSDCIWPNPRSGVNAGKNRQKNLAKAKTENLTKKFLNIFSLFFLSQFAKRCRDEMISWLINYSIDRKEKSRGGCWHLAQRVLRLSLYHFIKLYVTQEWRYACMHLRSLELKKQILLPLSDPSRQQLILSCHDSVQTV